MSLEQLANIEVTSVSRHAERLSDAPASIYVITADNPAGKWSEPHLVEAGKGLIDPCPFWDDDGRAWLAFRHRSEAIVETGGDASGTHRRVVAANIEIAAGFALAAECRTPDIPPRRRRGSRRQLKKM